MSTSTLEQLPALAERVMQCEGSAADTLAALDLDVICVIRGGGSRTDLATFDTEVIALAIDRKSVV